MSPCLHQKENAHTYLGMQSFKKNNLREETFAHYLRDTDKRGHETLFKKKQITPYI